MLVDIPPVPGAADISAEEEGNRVLKAIKLISRELPDAIISVDTFRADIAREAVVDVVLI